jgi:hypothetical protein
MYTVTVKLTNELEQIFPLKTGGRVLNKDVGT